MTTRIHTLIRWSIAAALAGGWSAAGCADPVEDSGNSNTNWLRSCTVDKDCSGLSCLCGVCTRSCATETCRGLDPLATCVTPTSSVTNAKCETDFPSGGICTKPCTNDGDCTTLSSSLRCLGGACLAGSTRSGVEAGVDSGIRNGTGGATGRDSSNNESGGATVRDSSTTVSPGTNDAPYDSAVPNCQSGGPGRSDCGPNHESCCASPVVTGGSFFRSYDAVTFLDNGHPATVSDFRLDKYEVTVGRFRDFVNAAVGGWRPAAGSGKHTHLNGGQGLADSSSPGTYESGWNAAWNNHLTATKPGWDSQLVGNPPDPVWTPSPGPHENQPIGRVDWYQAYAFCIWDDGFLPSEAEWNYAASGGSEQRVFPWSEPPNSTVSDCAHSIHTVTVNLNTQDSGVIDRYCASYPLDVGSASPAGDGKWGQADLAGNVYEWNLDWYASYSVPCTDCAFLSTVSEPVNFRSMRGGNTGSGNIPPGSILAAERSGNTPDGTVTAFGFRCARSP